MLKKLTCLAILLPSISYATSLNESFRRAGDILQVANPIGGLIIAANNDKHQTYTLGYIQCMCIVGVFKYAGHRTSFAGSRRPDGTSHRGMPSGHTTSAWAAAAHTRNPYLYATAGLTGLSRITNKRHYWYQVLASIVATESVVFLNKKISKKVWLDARIDPNKYSLNVRVLV